MHGELGELRDYPRQHRLAAPVGDGKHLLSLALINDFNKAVRRAVDDNVVGLITVHSGNSFSGGLDYNSAPEAVLVGAFASLIASLIKLPFPTVAKVTGQAYGAGFTLALAHDYLVLSTDSTVSLCQNELTEGHEVPSFAAALLFGKFPPSAAWELAVSTVPVAPQITRPYLTTWGTKRVRVEHFVADVAPRAVRARLLPELCEETRRGSFFTILDVVPRFDAVEIRDFETKILSPRSRFLEQVPASTFRILARSLRRSVGIQRNLDHWIRDFETKLQNLCLLNLDKVSLVGFNAFFAAVFWQISWSLIELDRDTLHTRLGSAHECHSGVRLVLLRWCRSCQLDLLSTDQLVWIEPIVSAGQGRVSSQSRDGYAYSPDLDWVRFDIFYSRYFDASYTGKIPLYTADLSAWPGNEISGA
uniref:Enoyl-CoA delta isomerase 1, peroxisomal n=1 Tax=Ananas comosus var. bracteatus TaxID=296719 RepID=A0A6V7QDF5_ANACO|nr:unnamed protein product [Ananas comosus var. bracteatus]